MSSLAEYHFEFDKMVIDCDPWMLLFEAVEKLLIWWKWEQN